MPADNPHYLLYSEAGRCAGTPPQWRFVLQPIGRDQFLIAADSEPDTHGNRLELLAVVRGLEALEQPSHVTLITRSRYVSRGIRHGLGQWRERHWRWERFGQLVPIRDLDLWQRVDRALQFHEVECCPSPFDEDEAAAEGKELDSAICIVGEPISPVAAGTSARTSMMAEKPDGALSNRPRLRQSPCRKPHGGRISHTFARLRQSVLAPLAAIWRPAFTRAA
jgi:ribonuclease HI